MIQKHRVGILIVILILSIGVLFLVMVQKSKLDMGMIRITEKGQLIIPTQPKRKQGTWKLAFDSKQIQVNSETPVRISLVGHRTTITAFDVVLLVNPEEFEIIGVQDGTAGFSVLTAEIPGGVVLTGFRPPGPQEKIASSSELLLCSLRLRSKKAGDAKVSLVPSVEQYTTKFVDTTTSAYYPESIQSAEVTVLP